MRNPTHIAVHAKPVWLPTRMFCQEPSERLDLRIRAQHGGDRIDHAIGIALHKKHVQRFHTQREIAFMLVFMLAIGANRIIVRHIIAPILHQTREQRLLFDGSVRRILIIFETIFKVIFEIIFVVFFGSILIMVRSLAFHNRSERNQRVHRGFDGCETGRTPLMPLISGDPIISATRERI